mmetsp:Transcript_5462/g.11266  ORF Transcript_5462/g.11266 Transcript_5462/m.11266 type:complete len:255 (-) Transcript_5462:459-1223(-)
MDDYGSFQNQTGIPTAISVYGAEDVALLRKKETTNSESSLENNSRTGTSRRISMSLLAGMALWFVVMAAELSPFLFLVTTDEYQSAGASTNNDDEYDDDDDDTLHAMWGSTAYNIRMCSVEECLSSPCQDSQSAPFVCLALKHNESIRGGCGRTPWAFEICSDQCNASGCPHLLERSDAVSESTHHIRAKEDCDTECPRDWCRRHLLCGDGENAPYQCTAGLSKFGCSSDKFEWTIRSTEEECSSCCKTTSCYD